MIILEELLRHKTFGKRAELLFFLFDGLSAGKNQPLENVRKYCISHAFTISESFEGIVGLFQFISFIEIVDDQVSLNDIYFDQSEFKKEVYLDQFHLYERLFHVLREKNVLYEMFNENNLKFNPKLSQYYVLENRFSYKYFPFRNIFLSTGFFHRDTNLENHLFVKKEFTSEFKNSIMFELSLGKTVRKISLTQLKKALQAKEDLGRRAELFALEFEYKRLNGHPMIDMVGIISEESANAGYDIESFDDVGSITFDRFIEVKSYQGEVSFFWSKNEIEKAKELRMRYYLYLVDRSRITENGYKPQQLQDPYKRVFESDVWRKETENWKFVLD